MYSGKQLMLGILFVFSLLLTPAVHAALILQYTSPLFDTFNGSVNNPNDGTERLTATITLDPSITALTDGLTITSGDVTAFSLSALSRTINNSSASLDSFFSLTIGPSGLPSQWEFGAEADLGEGNANPETMTSRGGFLGSSGLEETDIFGIDDSQPGASSTGLSNFARFAVNNVVPGNDLPGVWAVVPTPSAMLLMGSGLVGLIGWRWWSAKRN